MSDSDVDSGDDGGGGPPGSSKGGNARCIVIQGYHYTKDKFNRYKCLKARLQKCCARAHLAIDPKRVPEIGETGYCKVINSHSCGEAPGKRAGFKKQLRKRMIYRAVRELTLHPSTIYNQERENPEDHRLVQDMLRDLKRDAVKKVDVASPPRIYPPGPAECPGHAEQPAG